MTSVTRHSTQHLRAVQDIIDEDSATARLRPVCPNCLIPNIQAQVLVLYKYKYWYRTMFLLLCTSVLLVFATFFFFSQTFFKKEFPSLDLSLSRLVNITCSCSPSRRHTPRAHRPDLSERKVTHLTRRALCRLRSQIPHLATHWSHPQRVPHNQLFAAFF